MIDERRKQVADAKAMEVASAIDFMAAVAGKTELFTTSGITVEVRSLTYEEAEALMAKYSDNPIALTFHALLGGLVSPVLTAAQIEELRKSRPGPITAIAQRIMALSGLGTSDEKSPLAGGGLSDAQAAPK